MIGRVATLVKMVDGRCGVADDDDGNLAVAISALFPEYTSSSL